RAIFVILPIRPMTEHPPQLRDLPPEEKKRLAYIEGREDLFETKVFEMESSSDIEEQGQEKKNVLVISRDPGSANALWPVMELLYHDDTIAMKAIVDGRAEEILQDKFTMKDITPKDGALEAEQVLGTPDALLIDSSTSERGIEMYAAANYPDAPMVLVEDYYTASHGFLQRLKERKLPHPKKICVIDSEAKKLIVKEFPELEDRIEITGQPAFDRFATEDTEGIKTEVRKELGLAPDEKLVAFMGAQGELALLEKLAGELKKVKTKFRFAFGVHPRYNTEVLQQRYKEIFRNAGIEYIDTERAGVNNIGAVSDVVVIVVSAEGLHAICRRKPTIHIIDPKFVKAQRDLNPPPPVKLGASMGLDDMNGFATTIDHLLDPESVENIELRKHMEENYPVDGKNSERVVNILKAEIAEN
ncbi:MAG: hypothetical protein G01um101491_11, partial [Parcubacteria group bacterium Gr01-1014_91]